MYPLRLIFFSKCAYFQREIFFNEIRNQWNDQRVVRIFEQTVVPSFRRELEVAQLYFAWNRMQHTLPQLAKQKLRTFDLVKQARVSHWGLQVLLC